MPARRLRVLLVDDDVAFLRVQSRGLARSVDVTCAANGMRALDLAVHSVFDAVITDFEMAPGEDGLWLLEHVRSLDLLTCRVLTSARPIEMFTRSLRSGLVQAFVAKPGTIEDLLASISSRRPLGARTEHVMGAP